MAQIKGDVGVLSTTELLTKSSLIISKMTDNPYFPLPITLLGDIIIARNSLKQATASEYGGDRFMIKIENQKRQELSTLLLELYNYIELRSNDNQQMMDSTGFVLNDKEYILGEIPGPKNVRATLNRQQNGVLLRWKPVKDAKVYVVEINTEGSVESQEWHAIGYNTRAKMVITKLDSLEKCKFRIRTVTEAGASEPSRTVRCMA